ncbi:unnamed protein product [Rhizophagus irregularis]|nr:unnamed protein product [Rhizophagus irregularis]
MSNENGQTTSSTIQNTSQNKITKQDKLKIILRVGLMIFFEIALPFALYYTLKNYLRDIWALLISGIPPFIIAIYGLISRRRADIIGVIVVLSFILSAVASLIKDDPRIQLLRRSAITCIISAVLIISLIPIKIGTFKMKPLAFYFLKDMATGGSFGYSNSKVNLPGLTEDEPIDARWDRYWASYQYFRRGIIIMTALWGFGLLSEVPIRVIIIYKLSSIDQAFLLVNVIHYIYLIIMGLLTLVCAGWMKKQSDKIAADDVSDSDKPPE